MTMSYALRLITSSSVRYPTFAVSYLAHCSYSAKLISSLKPDRTAVSRHSANVIFPSPLVLAIEKRLLPNHQGFRIHNQPTGLQTLTWIHHRVVRTSLGCSGLRVLFCSRLHNCSQRCCRVHSHNWVYTLCHRSIFRPGL